MPGRVLYICPWSLRDPLCQSQSLAYLKGLATSGHRFSVITFESRMFAMSPEEIAEEKSILRNHGIEWNPVRWGAGNTLRNKIGGIARVIAKGLQIGIRTRPDVIHSRSSLPAFMAVLLKKLLRTKFVYDADSLLSEEYLETGHFSRESKAYKFLAWSEAWARRNADHIIVLTERLKQDYVERFGVPTPITVIPCCVDFKRFESAGDQRENRRAELGLKTEPLFIYVGKAGSWYMVEETFALFRAALDRRPDSRLLLITPDQPEIFLKLASAANVPISSFAIRSAGFSEVPEWLAAADVAVSLISPLPSKRGSSPIKFAEYLASGLPVIANPGIGDVDAVITANGVGTLLGEFTSRGYTEAIDEVERLGDISLRCRQTARREFDLQSVGGLRYRRLYSNFTGNS